MRRFLHQTVSCTDRLVDIGAGSRSVSSDLKAGHIVTLDIVAMTNPTVVADVALSLPLTDQCADAVIAGEILEHIVQSVSFLREIYRVLVPGGYLIISVPNVVSLKYRIAFLLGRIPSHAARADLTYAEGSKFMYRGHVRDYCFKDLRFLLEYTGFHVLKSMSTGIYWRGKRVVSPIVTPRTFGESIVMIAQKR